MCQAFYHILRSSKTHFTQGRLFDTQGPLFYALGPLFYALGPLFCTLGPLFCAMVREEAIFAVCKRCANEGFTCMCKEKDFTHMLAALAFVPINDVVCLLKRNCTSRNERLRRSF